MKSLPIHRITIIIKPKPAMLKSGKESKTAKTWTINTCSALPPLEDPLIVKRIRRKTGKELKNLIVNIEKGEFLGMSNKVY